MAFALNASLAGFTCWGRAFYDYRNAHKADLQYHVLGRKVAPEGGSCGIIRTAKKNNA